MGTWNNTATNKLLFEGGVLLNNSWQDSFTYSCAGIPSNRLYRDPTLSFPFNGNGPSQSRTGQRPFKQRFSMTYLAGSHRLKAGMAVDESLPYQSYVDRGPTPFTVTFRNGSPSSLTEYASPTNSNSEVKIRPDLGAFVQDQWTLHRITLNLGLRYQYHRTKADPVTTFAGPVRRRARSARDGLHSVLARHRSAVRSCVGCVRRRQNGRQRAGGALRRPGVMGDEQNVQSSERNRHQHQPIVDDDPNLVS